MEYKKKITEEIIEEILSKGVRDMPQNPASRGLALEQIRAFYYVPEEETLNLLLKIEEGIEEVINDIKYLFVIVDELPEASKDTIGKIYLVEKETSSEGNKYTEFLTIEKDNVYYWERIGLKEINIVYDDELSLSSENPIKNKVVTKALLERVHKDQLVTINGKSLMQGKDVNIEIKDGVDEATLNEKLSKYQKIDSVYLTTEAKTIVGAINELNEKVGNSSGADIDLTEYVKKTDYAGKGVAGVVMTGENTGIAVSPSTHNIYILKANDTQITTKTNHYAPIVSSNLDLAVKVGMTTNALEWTEKEKASARNLIGIEKLYKHTVSFVGISEKLVVISTDITPFYKVSNGMESMPEELDYYTIIPNGIDSIRRSYITHGYEDNHSCQCLIDLGETVAPNTIKSIVYNNWLDGQLKTLYLPELNNDTVTEV